MLYNPGRRDTAIDQALVWSAVLLAAFGLVMVYSASAALARQQQPLTFNPFLIKQAVAAGLGLVLMVWLMVLDYRTLRRPAVVYSLLFGVIALLVLVLFAPERNAPTFATPAWYWRLDGSTRMCWTRTSRGMVASAVTRLPRVRIMFTWDAFLSVARFDSR